MRYRQSKPEPVKDRILILCEGIQTEPNYFKAIKTDKQFSNKLAATRIVIHETKINTAKELVSLSLTLKKEAEKDRNPYQQIWVVVDRDGYSKHPESFDRAQRTGVRIAFSSSCFEFWILLHFEYSTSGFLNCDAVIKKLKSHLPGYEKAHQLWPILKPKTETAITHGQKIMRHSEAVNPGPIWNHNPYTNVSELVGLLMGL